MSSPLDVIDSTRATSAVLTTFSLNLDFFDYWVLPLLSKAGVRNIVVVADEGIVAEQLAHNSSTKAGRSYHLVSLRFRGVFHPKLIYLSGPDGATCCVSSANLTPAGQLRNYETGAVLTSTVPQHSGALRDAALFLRRLVEAQPKSVIDASLTALPIEDVGFDASAQSVRFIHNLDRPIAEQLPGGPVRAIAPFISAEAIRRLDASHGVEPIVHADTREAIDNTREAVDSFTTIRFLDSKGETASQRLHGKAIWSDEAGWCLVGSPNLTSAALYRPATSGNVEAAVLFENATEFVLPPHRVEDPPDPSKAADWERADPSNHYLSDGTFTAFLDGDLQIGGLPDGAKVDTATATGWEPLGTVADGRIENVPVRLSRLRCVLEKRRLYAIVHDVPRLRARRAAKTSASAAVVENLPLDMQAVRQLESILGDLYALDALLADASPAPSTRVAVRQVSGIEQTLPPLSEWMPQHDGDEPLVPDVYRQSFKGSPDALLALVRQALRLDRPTPSEVSVEDDEESDEADAEAMEELKREPPTTAEVVRHYRSSFIRSLARGVAKIKQHDAGAGVDLLFQNVLIYHETLSGLTVRVEEKDARALGYDDPPGEDGSVEISLVEPDDLRKPRIDILIAYASKNEDIDPMCRPTLLTHLAAALADGDTLTFTERRHLEDIGYRFAETLLATADPTLSTLQWISPERCVEILTPLASRTNWEGVLDHIEYQGWIEGAVLTTEPCPMVTGSHRFHQTNQSPAWQIIGQACIAGYKDKEPFVAVVHNDQPESPWLLHLLQVQPGGTVDGDVITEVVWRRSDHKWRERRLRGFRRAQANDLLSPVGVAAVMNSLSHEEWVESAEPPTAARRLTARVDETSSR